MRDNFVEMFKSAGPPANHHSRNQPQITRMNAENVISVNPRKSAAGFD